MTAGRSDATEVRGISTRLLVRAATRSEYLLSIVRIAFCALGLARYIYLCFLQPFVGVHFALSVLPYLVAAAISTWILTTARRRSLSVRFFYASVALDAVLCFIALLPNVLWPWPTYTTIIHTADLSIVYVIIVSSALRLSPAASLLSGALNLGSSVALIALDSTLGIVNPPDPNEASMVLLICLASTGLAMVVAKRTRRLVEDTGLATWRHGMAERTLNLMLEEHHGTRSLLSAAKLHADHLLERSGKDATQRSTEELQSLHSVLTQLVKLSVESRERSFAELATLRGLGRVELVRVAENTAKIVAGRFPQVHFTLTGDVGEGDVAIVGGNASFERILLNLLTNACEGDGKSSAREVEIRFERQDGGLSMTVLDDGPGFPERVLEQEHEVITTKSDGTGIGLYLVQRLLEASSGKLRRFNRDNGGAGVAVFLPALDEEAPPLSDVEPVVSSVRLA